MKIKLKNLTYGGSFNRILIYKIIILLINFTHVFICYPQCGMTGISSGGFTDYSTGTDCIFQMNDGNTYGRYARVKFDNYTPHTSGDDFISIASGFDQTFNVYLGCYDPGGDGLAFVFSAVAMSWTPDYGAGLGWSYKSYINTVAIEFDTFENDNTDTYPIKNRTPVADLNWDNEIADDHIALDFKAEIDSIISATPVQARPNMEDGQIHKVRIYYDGASSVLVYWDGSLAYSATANLISILGSSVQWAWTSGTGGVVNEMWVSWNGTTTPPSFTPVKKYPVACNLPVHFLDISANETYEGVIITWETAYESSNKTFVIEKSYDSDNWYSIGELPGTGSSSTNLTYDFTDRSYSSGELVYYRIKQLDNDGQYTFSNIVSVKSTNNQNVMIYPNPFEDKIKIKSIEGIIKLELFNLQGICINEVNSGISKIHSYEFNAEVLQPGIYFIKATEIKGKISVNKIIKQ